MKTKRVISIMLIFVFVLAGAAFVSAANVHYRFDNLTSSEGNTEMTPYWGAYNTKTIKNDPATISCSDTDALGLGCLMYLGKKSGSTLIQATDQYWYNNNSYLLHPAYKSGMNTLNANYYIAARIDNDYAGPYYIEGYFNADYTTPPRA